MPIFKQAGHCKASASLSQSTPRHFLFEGSSEATLPMVECDDQMDTVGGIKMHGPVSLSLVWPASSGGKDFVLSKKRHLRSGNRADHRIYRLEWAQLEYSSVYRVCSQY